MGRITLRLSDELEVELKQQAKDKGITITEHCRNILSGQTTTAKENFDTVNDRLTNSAREFHKVCEAISAMRDYLYSINDEGQQSQLDTQTMKDIKNLLSAVASNQNQMILSLNETTERAEDTFQYLRLFVKNAMDENAFSLVEKDFQKYKSIHP